jgi:hypothetical protein
MEDLDELLTTAEYARERKSSERTIERERTSGTGCKFVKIGRSVRYRRRDILDFIARHVRGTTSELASPSHEEIVGGRTCNAKSVTVVQVPSPSLRSIGSRLTGPFSTDRNGTPQPGGRRDRCGALNSR